MMLAFTCQHFNPLKRTQTLKKVIRADQKILIKKIVDFIRFSENEESYVTDKLSSTFPCLLLLKPRCGVYVRVKLLTASRDLGFYPKFQMHLNTQR